MLDYPLQFSWPSLVAQMVKNLPATQETWVRSLGWEDPLEKGTATHSSILAWRILWTEEPGRLQYMGSQESDTAEQLKKKKKTSASWHCSKGWGWSSEQKQKKDPAFMELTPEKWKSGNHFSSLSSSWPTG